MPRDTEFTLAAIQAAPVFFDRDASTEKACALIEQAAGVGATLAAFGETWLPGYPSFAYTPQHPAWSGLAARYLANAIDVPGPIVERLCRAARQAEIDVVIGVVERDGRTGGTVYCAQLVIGREGRLLGKHRKLKPTFVERTIWGEGDGSSLVVHPRPYGRISSLNCWEHNMLLPGYALIGQGTQIHVGSWPGGAGARQIFLSQAFASQAACYVVCAAGVERPEDLPEEARELGRGWTGDSCVIDPWGNVIAGPAEGETILTATGSTELIRKAKAICDTAGHYSRPDVFQLRVDRRPRERVALIDGLAEQSVNGAAEWSLADAPAGDDGIARDSHAVAEVTGDE